MEGYIREYRKIMQWRWYRDIAVAHLFRHLILSANYIRADWQDITISRGQLVTSRQKLAYETGLTEKMVRRCLKALEKTGEIQLQSSNKYTLITICKYSEYQGTGDSIGQHRANTGPAEGLQRATIEEGKKENIGGTIVPSSSPESTTPKTDDINLLAFMEFFNKTMQEHGAQIPTITQISGKRKQALLARLKQHGKEALRKAVINAATSTFLNGGGSKPFVASFDWIMKPNNFPKVLEGNYSYDLSPNNNSSHGTGQQLTAQQRIDAELERGAEYAKGILARNDASIRDGVPAKVW